MCKLIVSAVVLIAFLAVLEAIVLKKCRDFPEFDHVRVSGCEGDVERCPFIRGANTSLFTNFTSTVHSKNLTLSVWGKLTTLRIKTPFPMKPNDACHYGISCPIHVNQSYTMNIQMPIKSLYPAVNVEVGIEIWGKNDDNRDIRVACVSFPAKITDKASN